MNHYTYFIILLISLAGPFALSFDKKVHFYKKWRYALPAILFPALLYILWDRWFTGMNVWSFNPEYITGVWIFGLPIEEVLFFFIVPYCCIFIYECVRTYFPDMECTKCSDLLLGGIGCALLITGIIYRDLSYTFSTCIFTAIFIACILVFRNYFNDFNTKTFLIAFVIILIPFLVVNGFLTALPVVLYNEKENLGLRIYTIPAEDVFYGMLLIMLNIAGYEKLKSRRKKNPCECTGSNAVIVSEL